MELIKYVIGEDKLIEEAIAMIELNSSRCVIVHKNNNKVVGIVSEGDILRGVLKGLSIHAPVKQIMNTNFVHLMSKDNDRMISLFKKGITLIPILDENYYLTEVVELVSFFNQKENE